MYRHHLKPVFDSMVGLLALLIFSPLLLIIVLGILLQIGTPVLFTQKRPGLNGKPFVIYKFRTMTNKRDSKGKLLSDEKRLTSFGRFLRSTSLDELPELYNVLKGEMSLVGPRPLLTRYLKLYTPEQARRHDVRPGITGWAQINGRNEISWEKKFALDIWYIDNMSFWLDIKILFLTLWKVISREGIKSEGHATMPEFFGTKSEQDNSA